MKFSTKITKRRTINHDSMQWNLYRPLCQTPPISRSLWLSHLSSAAIALIMIKAALGFSSKESALAFYGVYHREPINQVIHFVGVPGIIFSLFVFLFHIGPVANALTIQLPGIPIHSVNWATLYALFYQIFYTSIDPWGSLLYSPVLYFMYGVAASWTNLDRRQAMQVAATTTTTTTTTGSKSPNWYGTGRVIKKSALIHVACWYTQIQWGHKMIEGAQPAVMQSLGGALTTAPLFAFYEGVWALGYQKELHNHVKTLADQITRDLCEQGIVMRACDSLK